MIAWFLFPLHFGEAICKQGQGQAIEQGFNANWTHHNLKFSAE
jgi:hypothetical protein